MVPHHRPGHPHATRSHRPFLHGLALLLFLLPALAFPQQQQKQPLTRILFVMDASNSMNAFWGTEPKFTVAKRILLDALGPIEDAPNVELALRIYGHQTRIEPGKQDCDDTKLEVPFAPHNGQAIREKMNSVRCLGTTPIARSLEKAAGDFPDTKARNVIILITDGIEACDEDPCAVSRALQAKGIILKPFVIGVGLEDAGKYSLECVGNYYDAGSPEMFDHVLKVVIDQALNTTTTQLLLLTDDSKPTVTDVPVTFYDQNTGRDLYDFVHTMALTGQPDTISIDPVYTYRIVAHTVPPSVKEYVTIQPGVHNVIALVAGQGQLDLKIDGAITAENPVSCLVRKTGETELVNAQPMNTAQLYRTGTYDLEVLTLPRLRIPGVVIKQDEVTPVSIPKSGVVNILTKAPGPGGIFVKNGNALEWVVDLDARVSHNQFRLLPGEYRVIFRPADARQTAFSIVKDFSVVSGRAVNVEL
jgi:Ca-activated chloride channel family protein